MRKAAVRRAGGQRGRARLGAALLALSSAAGAAAGDAGGLPPDGVPAGWRRVGPGRTFTGSELYGHIDGGAEPFLELGFASVEVQAYGNGSEQVTLEAYRMSDPVAALGIYLTRCGRETPVPGLVGRSTLGPHQLMLARGASFVVATSASGRATAAPALLALGRFMADRLPAEAPPDPAAPLPGEGRIEGTLRIIRGPVALESIVTLGEGDVLRLDRRVTAVAADYHDGGGGRFTRIVADYGSDEQAATAFAHLAGHLDSTLKVLRRDAAGLLLQDYAGRFATVALAGPRLEVHVNLARPPAGR